MPSKLLYLYARFLCANDLEYCGVVYSVINDVCVSDALDFWRRFRLTNTDRPKPIRRA